jgi:hypothetical protein
MLKRSAFYFLLIGVVLFSFTMNVFGQVSFYIEEADDPAFNLINDIKANGDEYYFLMAHFPPEGSSYAKNSSIQKYSNQGLKINEDAILLQNFHAYQILNLTDTSLTLLGGQKNDTCTAMLKILEIQLTSNSVNIVDQYSLCNGKYLQKAILINGIDDANFIQCQYGSDDRFYRALFQWKKDEGITMIFDSLSVYENFGVDFSRKGYILKSLDVCNFYTRDFQYRKQRYNFLDGYQPSPSSTLMPFNDHYVLEHVKKPDDPPYQGQVLRVVDSLLNVKKINSISLPAPFNPEVGFMDLPFFGGLKKTEDDHYWMAGTFSFWPDWDSNYYCISKFDPELNLVCNQFLGFDAVYRLFGTTATPDGGCIVYGWRLPKGGIINTGDENYFAIKVGPNCELPTTSTSDPDHPLIAISAFPNPAANTITFDVQGFDPTILYVEIFNAQGITLFSRQDLSYEITVMDLPAGHYFYRIMQGDKILGVGGWVKE